LFAADLSRLENAPSLKDAIRLTYALVDQWMASYEREPASVILDIDDTCDVAHGHQQLSLFNAHYDERCFLPIHVYDTERSRPVAFVLRPARRRAASRCARICVVSCVISASAGRRTRITFRGDGHYARPERCNGAKTMGRLRVRLARFKNPAEEGGRGGGRCAHRTRRARRGRCARLHANRHAAKSWSRERRAVARIEATALGLDIRFVVTNLEHGSPEWIYDSLYCARGQMENLIKLHKTQLASDRTSCRSAIANQVRLVLHTAAYWLMLDVRDAIPKPRDLAKAEFATLRLRLIKIAAALSKPPVACASPLPPAVRKPICSAACPRPSCRAARNKRGVSPDHPPIPPARSTKYSSSGGEKTRSMECAANLAPSEAAQWQVIVNWTG